MIELLSVYKFADTLFTMIILCNYLYGIFVYSYISYNYAYCLYTQYYVLHCNSYFCLERVLWHYASR